MPVDAWLDRLRAARAGGDAPHVLVVAAHAGDETIGASACIASTARRCRVAHVTDGAPAERRFLPAAAAKMTRVAYARLRREEALRAMAVAGLDATRTTCFGVRDLEGAFEMKAIAERLASLFVELAPEIVITHAYEGGHPDHDAAAFAVHAAAEIARGRASPAVVEMAGYHDCGGSIVRGEFLAVAGAGHEVAMELDDTERSRKRAMLAAYATRRETLAAFRIDVERLRVAPRYRFGAPPHGGRLHYERYGFPIAGATWRAFARAAMRRLRLAEGRL